MIRFAAIGILALTPVIIESDTKQICDPIGRIAQGSSRNFRRAQIVCSGNTITNPQGMQFLCLANGALVHLVDGQNVLISEATCRQNLATESPRVRQCSRRGISRLLCIIAKAPEEQFQLIEPEAVSQNPRPAISWEEVSEAESYVVQVIGPNIAWQRTTPANITEMVYPVDEPSLNEGNAYEVIVVANLPEASFTASKVVNITDDETISLK